MGASVQTRASRFASFKAIETKLEKIEPPRRPRLISARPVVVRESRAFPEASTSPALTITIRDETLEFYAFVFCESGFRQLGMTFGQFLRVAAAIKPDNLPESRERW